MLNTSIQSILSFAIPHDIVAAPIRPSHILPHRGDAGNMARQALLRSLARSPATATLNATRTARTFATSARRQAEVELTVDGKKVSIEGMAMDWSCEACRPCTDALEQPALPSSRPARKRAPRSPDTATTRNL